MQLQLPHQGKFVPSAGVAVLSGKSQPTFLSSHVVPANAPMRRECSCGLDTYWRSLQPLLFHFTQTGVGGDGDIGIATRTTSPATPQQNWCEDEGADDRRHSHEERPYRCVANVPFR